MALELPPPSKADHELHVYRTLTIRIDVTEALDGRILEVGARFNWTEDDFVEETFLISDGETAGAEWATVGNLVRRWLKQGARGMRSEATFQGGTVTRR